MRAPLPANEIQRIRELADLHLPENLEENFFDRFTAIAASIVEAPVAMVNFIEFDRQKTRSCFGVELGDMPREESVCQYTILESDYFEVNDLAKDPRFENLPYVEKGLRLRYYLGVPIKSPGGTNIGALCILDYEPREIEDDKIDKLILLANEISHKLELYADKNQAYELARKRNQVVKTLAHDIRNPLSGLVNMVNLIQEEINTDTDIENYLVTIEESCQNLIEYLDELTNQHREEAKRDQTFDKITLTELRDKVKALYQSRLLMKNQNLVFTFSGPAQHSQAPVKKLPVGINISAYVQIVGNLVSNAIKFSNRGDQIEVSLIVDVTDQNNSRTGNHLITEVRDYGQGMTQTDIDNMFQATKGDSGTSGEQSQGLGLYLTQKTLQDEGGSIEIDTEVDVGTLFRVKMPILFGEQLEE